MKAKQYRELTIEELEQKHRELLKERHETKIKKCSGKLDNPLILRGLRRDIARINTAMRERGNASGR